MVKKIYFIILAVIVALLAGMGAAAGYYFWKSLNEEKQSQRKEQHQVQQEQQQVQQEQQQVQQEQQKTQQDLQNKINSLETQISQQSSQLQEFQAQLTQMIASEQKNAHSETLNEVAYLLDLANLYLQINQDPETAIKSLQLAQHHVQALADPRLLPLQQALAGDINHLNDVKPVDTANILIELQNLSESIGRLSLIPHPLTAVSAPNVQQTPSAKNHPKWWSHAWQTFWQNFKSLFAIRYTSTNASSLLPPQQREWAQQNIAFTLAEAQWAVLQKKPALYQQSLNQVQQLLQTDYPDTLERQKILGRISQLVSINIAPVLPNMDASIRAIQIALQNPSSEKLQPPAPAPAAAPSNSSGTLAPAISPGIEI